MNDVYLKTFEKSESIEQIAKALVKFHRTCPPIPKTESNPFLRSKYADLSGILAIVTPMLNECGLTVIQSPIADNGLMTMLAHESGEFLKTVFFINPLAVIVDKESKEKAVTPQSIGSAITYQRRYALQSILNLNIEHDNDGGDVSAKVEKKKVKSAKEILAEKKGLPGGEQTESPAAEAKQEVSPTLAAATEPGKSPEGMSSPLDGPCLPSQIAEVKALIAEWARIKPGVDKDFVANLHASGRQRIAELTQLECIKLITAISNKKLGDFFEASLAKK